MKTQMTSGVEQRIGGTVEPFDLVAIEYQAREMRAEFLADAVRRAARWFATGGRDARKTTPAGIRAA
jgi:hypothetical protein